MPMGKLKVCLRYSRASFERTKKQLHYISYNLLGEYSNWLTVVIQELIHAKSPDCGNTEGMDLLGTKSMLAIPNWGKTWGQDT